LKRSRTQIVRVS